MASDGDTLTGNSVSLFLDTFKYSKFPHVSETTEVNLFRKHHIKIDYLYCAQ